MTGIKIIGAVLDTRQLLLYKEDGSTISLPQGDPRIRPIVDQIMPILNAGGVATITLEAFNEYEAFEKKTNGLIKLFRVAKKAVAHLFGSDEDRVDAPVSPMAAGKTPDVNPITNPASRAVDEIMANATPVSAPQFHESKTTESETMIAVIGEGADAKILPGVEALKGQMAHANKHGSTKGMEALISRLTAIIDAGNRGHSVQDVLRFLELGDLPIADDGSIIAYKILRNTPKGGEFKAQEGRFFDCHTGRIPQQVGSYVCVDEHLVDRNRGTECSNGLHIARRQYLGSFPGDVCVLIKLAPEDVVTVPHQDPNKVRVSGYHIIGLIPQTEFQLLRSNRPMTESSECQKLLTQALTGQHVPRLEEVRVMAQQGAKVQITSLVNAKVSVNVEKTEPIPNAVALPDKGDVKTAEPVDPEQVSQKSQDQRSAPSRTTLAVELSSKVLNKDLPLSQRIEAAEALFALKKRSKVSWNVLGITDEKVIEQAEYLAAPSAVKGKIEESASAQSALVQAAKEAQKLNAPIKVTKIKATTQPAMQKTVPLEPPHGASRSEVAKFYWAIIYDMGLSAEHHKQAATSLLAHKKKVKVGWGVLGLPEDAGKQIEKLIK